MIGLLIGKEAAETDTPGEDRDKSDTSTSQGMPRIDIHHLRRGEKRSHKILRESSALLTHSDCRLLASRTVRQASSIILSLAVCGRKLMQ